MRRLPLLCAIAALWACTVPRVAPTKLESLWYSVRGEQSVQSFLAHADQISIVSPQVFSLDSNGIITGSIDPRVVAAAHEHHVKLVPLVMNPGFDQPSIHKVLNDPSARARAIRSLAALCRDQHLDGIQFDIENVHVRDKDALTSFTRESVDSVHHAGCTLSAAVVPRTGEDPGPTNYHKWIYDNWRAVYDYKALADTLDFISYMTYAQHTGGSPAGPVAGYPWMKASLEYVLSLGVPPGKISLGIPVVLRLVVSGVRFHRRLEDARQRRFVHEGEGDPRQQRDQGHVGRRAEGVLRRMERARRVRVRMDGRFARVPDEARPRVEIPPPRLFRVGARL